jgi:hypothetical protein
MNQRSTPVNRQPWPFSLRSLFVATTFVAMTSAAVRHIAVTPEGQWDSSIDPFGQLMAFFSIPVLLCGCIGVLRGHLKFWLTYGVAIDLIVLGILVLARLAPGTL